MARKLNSDGFVDGPECFTEAVPRHASGAPFSGQAVRPGRLEVALQGSVLMAGADLTWPQR